MKKNKELTLEEWINLLENRHNQEIQLGLTRIKQVAQSLNLLSLSAKIITIGGTNGKGSTVATLEAIYLAAGYQVASYTSPHLLRFNERIRINRRPISDVDACRAFSVIEEGRSEIDLTYFEMITLAAFWYFKQHQLDLIILEVGMGGRLDATNIMDSDLAIITTIDFDHQLYLGNTKESIGFEKAGILRPNKPFIFADKNPPLTLLKEASLKNTKAYFYERDYFYELKENSIELSFEKRQLKLPKPNLHPNSVSAAIVSSILLNDELPVTEYHWQEALSHVFLEGRLQLIPGKIPVLIDVSHNPQSAKFLAEYLKNFHKKKVHAVFSALKDKDIEGILHPLKDSVDYWYPALLNTKRALTMDQLRLAFQTYGQPDCYVCPELAYKTALEQAKEGDLIVVFGSFITAGTILQFIAATN